MDNSITPISNISGSRKRILPHCSVETPPGMLYPSLGFSAEEGYGTVGVRPEEDQQDN